MKNKLYFSVRPLLISLICSAALILFGPLPVLAAWPYIIFPNDAGITLAKGETYTIEWASVLVSPVAIDLCTEITADEVDCFYSIAVGVPNSGSYSWTVPGNLPNGSNYLISVGVVGVSVAVSDNAFTISDSIPASWSIGAWGDCSVRCGGGTKTRDVNCKDSSGVIVDDKYCSATKPSSTSSCNTNPCSNGMPWLPIILD